jgi:antitoxin (DNA-binding transcriptional repressor) of toxin-antitoxin stability system
MASMKNCDGVPIARLVPSATHQFDERGVARNRARALKDFPAAERQRNELRPHKRNSSA